jgi:hypothetical protein
MVQFEPFSPIVEVNGETVTTTINSFPEFMKEIAIYILEKDGIKNPKPGNWCSQRAWLNSFREISDNYGSNTFFKLIVE